MADDNIRLIALQFIFTNPKIIPSSIGMKEETASKPVVIKQQNTGAVLIESTPRVSLEPFIDDLRDAGYELVDAFYQPRENPKTGYPFYMVRFVFVHQDYVEISPEFKEKGDSVYLDLGKMCHEAMWRTKVFCNPYYKDNEQIPGEYTLSVNLAARESLLQPDGKPILVWKKDEHGKRVGDAPSVPIMSDYHLRIKEGSVQIL